MLIKWPRICINKVSFASACLMRRCSQPGSQCSVHSAKIDFNNVKPWKYESGQKCGLLTFWEMLNLMHRQGISMRRGSNAHRCMSIPTKSDSSQFQGNSCIAKLWELFWISICTYLQGLDPEAIYINSRSIYVPPRRSCRICTTMWVICKMMHQQTMWSYSVFVYGVRSWAMTRELKRKENFQWSRDWLRRKGKWKQIRAMMVECQELEPTLRHCGDALARHRRIHQLGMWWSSTCSVSCVKRSSGRSYRSFCGYDLGTWLDRGGLEFELWSEVAWIASRSRNPGHWSCKVEFAFRNQSPQSKFPSCKWHVQRGSQGLQDHLV